MLITEPRSDEFLLWWSLRFQFLWLSFVLIIRRYQFPSQFWMLSFIYRIVSWSLLLSSFSWWKMWLLLLCGCSWGIPQLACCSFESICDQEWHFINRCHCCWDASAAASAFPPLSASCRSSASHCSFACHSYRFIILVRWGCMLAST